MVKSQQTHENVIFKMTALISLHFGLNCFGLRPTDSQVTRQNSARIQASCGLGQRPKATKKGAPNTGCEVRANRKNLLPLVPARGEGWGRPSPQQEGRQKTTGHCRPQDTVNSSELEQSASREALNQCKSRPQHDKGHKAEKE